MPVFAFLFLFLPVLEIIGFIVIGGRIGLDWSLLWLLASAVLGSMILKSRGRVIFMRVQQAQPDDFFLAEDLFDDLCLLIGALLLIFPGFISDFLAIPFLLAPLRRWIFGWIKSNPNHIVRRYTRTHTTIEGEFTRTDDTDKLPK